MAFIAAVASVNAQSYKETFDSNSLDWTENAYENKVGMAVIDKGVMTITSIGGGTNLWTGQWKPGTFCETHCYAPIDVLKPFEIHSIVNVSRFTEENFAGIIFNYKDNGNLYGFSFNETGVFFERLVDIADAVPTLYGSVADSHLGSHLLFREQPDGRAGRSISHSCFHHNVLFELR